jgi:hypothetical protein
MCTVQDASVEGSLSYSKLKYTKKCHKCVCGEGIIVVQSCG